MSGWGWGAQSHGAAAGAGAGGAGGGGAAGGKAVAVHKVDKIDHVMNMVTRPTGPSAGYYYGGGERSSWDDGRRGANDINRKAEDFIKKQRSKWSLVG